MIIKQELWNKATYKNGYPSQALMQGVERALMPATEVPHRLELRLTKNKQLNEIKI